MMTNSICLNNWYTDGVPIYKLYSIMHNYIISLNRYFAGVSDKSGKFKLFIVFVNRRNRHFDKVEQRIGLPLSQNKILLSNFI